jgi:hypothetical protein
VLWQETLVSVSYPSYSLCAVHLIVASEYLMELHVLRGTELVRRQSYEVTAVILVQSMLDGNSGRSYRQMQLVILWWEWLLMFVVSSDCPLLFLVMLTPYV